MTCERTFVRCFCICCPMMLLLAALTLLAQERKFTGIHWGDSGAAHPDKESLKKLFEESCAALQANSPERAMKSLAEAANKDKQNGFLFFLAAGVHAQRKDWKQVIAHLKAGNKCAESYEYVTMPTFGKVGERQRPHFAQLRAVARFAIALPADVPASVRAEALKEVRQMGAHVARSYPREMLSVLVGVAIRKIATQGMVNLYQETQEPSLSNPQTLLAAEDRWSEQVKSLAKQLVESLQNQAPRAQSEAAMVGKALELMPK